MSLHPNFESGSIDVISTTSVFEHVPADVCDAIIAEFRRVIHKDGLMSHTVDYSDHYAHADSNITSYNYLQFDERRWKMFNPGIHFQNRLRTKDYSRKFDANGFQIVEMDEWVGSPNDLNKVAVHKLFNNYDRESLLTLGCHFVLKPNYFTE